VAEGVYAPGHLGELTQLVLFEMVDAALAECGAVQQRLRKLPARVVVHLLLAASLFAECGTRRLYVTGVTTNPTREWTLQQARNLAADLGVRMESLHFLLRDRDGKYGAAFDAVFEAEELDVIKSAARAPRVNAHCERLIGSIRREVLDRVLILDEAHARQVLAAYQQHHNEHRPHQVRNQLPPDAHEQPAATDIGTRRLLRTRILGGLVNEYRYAA
jgi:hypothetical protein